VKSVLDEDPSVPRAFQNSLLESDRR